MDNYTLTNSAPIKNTLYWNGEEMDDPTLQGAYAETYTVTNKAWNEALRDDTRHANFIRHMQDALHCELVQDIKENPITKQFTFSALNF
jgi:hypothetical protein